MLRNMPDRDALVAALRDEGLRVIEWTDEPGGIYPEHVHPGLEVRVVLEGSMTIWAAGETHELGPGDRFDILPSVPHGARVGPEGVRFLAGTRL
jgi:quercetin dioxygenase-like cupin family protein